MYNEVGEEERGNDINKSIVPYNLVYPVASKTFSSIYRVQTILLTYRQFMEKDKRYFGNWCG